MIEENAKRLDRILFFLGSRNEHLAEVTFGVHAARSFATAGTVVGGVGAFERGHVSAHEGSKAAKVSLTNTADQGQSTATGSVLSAKHHVLTHGTATNSQADRGFSVVVGFSGTEAANVVGDFTARSDGITIASTISRWNTTFTASGSDTCTHVGHENLTVTLKDDASTSASADPTANVSSAKQDFNGDGNADLLFQNNDGTSDLWEINGTVAIMTELSKSSSSWQVLGVGDFNGDGYADILFKNSDGRLSIWEMNGTSIVSQAVLPDPGRPCSWQVICTGHFNGDGTADVLFQNSDGTLSIWEMNGTSIVSQAVLPDPARSCSWQAIGAGDFNGDGDADVLWQGSNGTGGVWLMNGIAATTQADIGVTDPGTNKQFVTSADFDGDRTTSEQVSIEPISVSENGGDGTHFDDDSPGTISSERIRDLFFGVNNPDESAWSYASPVVEPPTTDRGPHGTVVDLAQIKWALKDTFGTRTLDTDPIFARVANEKDFLENDSYLDIDAEADADADDEDSAGRDLISAERVAELFFRQKLFQPLVDLEDKQLLVLWRDVGQIRIDLDGHR